MGVRGCLTGGCIGCAGVLLLTAGVVAIVGTSARRGEPEPVERQLVHELPGASISPSEDRAAGDEGVAATATLPLEAPMGSPPPPGRLVVDISKCRFALEPGEAGQPIRVEADFDANRFVLTESFEQADDGSWSYALGFDSRSLFSSFGSDRGPRVTLVVPPGHPFALEGSVSMGESRLELGGLAVTSVRLDLSSGDHRLGFSTPTAEPLDSLVVDSRFGEFRLAEVGNASPRLSKIEHQAGELTLDLEGEWREDADIDVSFRWGACRIEPPNAAKLEIEQASVSMGQSSVESGWGGTLPATVESPVVRLSVEGTGGELSGI